MRGALQMNWESVGVSARKAFETDALDEVVGRRNARGGREITGYLENHGWGRRLASTSLPLRYESVGIEQD